MNILFIHQNFPGQYKHLAPTLAARGHRCVALTLRVKKAMTWKGLEVLPYKIARTQGGGVHPWLLDMDTKLIRAEACYNAARALRDQGFRPDVILAHPGWGEALFLRDVWPDARIGLYCEWYYGADEAQGFDPEFAIKDAETETLRLRMKNLNNMLNAPLADAVISPTQYQANKFPDEIQKRITVIHDGIDTDKVRPDPDVRFELDNGAVLTREDEVVTFLNRNLEPYRGYHTFMRALPELLHNRPKAQVLIVGGDGVSYGGAPAKGKTWKQIYIDEVRGDISDEDWARVHFLGTIDYDRFLRLLQVSTVHVYLTYPFVLSWSLLEAMSAGAAIVGSDTAPVREVIEDQKTGVLVDFFNVSGLVKTLGQLLDDAELRGRLGQQARRQIVQGYDLNTRCLPRLINWVEGLSTKIPTETPD